jgi:glycosyltransferase involved in cell wall biosynthesis
MTVRFSIVIPARDRARTLPYTLRTCLEQEFGDFEIIVSDNCSTDMTREVVAGIADKRIHYVRSQTPLSMCDSWEFAIRQAGGEFIIVAGADDGLLLHALAEIDRLLRILDTRILHWQAACYNWPDLPHQDHAPPHALLLPLRKTDDFYAIQHRQSKPWIADAANSRRSYTELPMVQCAAIHRSLYERLRARTGRIFKSQCPDVYSSFAFAALAGSYYSVAVPMTINGLSGNSNGVACIYLKERSAVADEFSRLNTQANHVRHPRAPGLPVMPAYVADSFLHARDALFPDGDITLDRKQLTLNCIQQARFACEEEWRLFRAALGRSLQDDAELLRWFDASYGSRLWTDLAQSSSRLSRYGGSYQYLDASDFGVTNIHEAAQLCEKLLGCKRDGVNAHVVAEPSVPSRMEDGIAAAAKSVADLQWVEICLSRLLSRLVPTNCMIDVGAHHGTALAPFLHAGWKVHAFEPIEANRRQLAATFPVRGWAGDSQRGGQQREWHGSVASGAEPGWNAPRLSPQPGANRRGSVAQKRPRYRGADDSSGRPRTARRIARPSRFPENRLRGARPGGPQRRQPFGLRRHQCRILGRRARVGQEPVARGRDDRLAACEGISIVPCHLP